MVCMDENDGKLPPIPEILDKSSLLNVLPSLYGNVTKLRLRHESVSQLGILHDQTRLTLSLSSLHQTSHRPFIASLLAFNYPLA